MTSEEKIYIQHKRKREKEPVKEEIFNPNKKKKEENTILDDTKENNKIIITSINKYYSKLIKEDWKNKQIHDLRKYCESLIINAESNYELLIQLINIDFDLFVELYSKYQFTLTIKQRKEIQKLITNFQDYPMINNNIINDEIKSIRDLFLKICDLILNIKLNEDNCLETLKDNIINNGVYIEDSIEFLFPVNFGNTELKFNKLIIDLLFFIFGKNMGKLNTLNHETKQLIKKKISLFTETNIFFQKSGYYDDETLFKISNYLINCYYIYFNTDNSLQDYDNLVKIISCCLPFELDVAIDFIKKSNNLSYNITFEIDNTELYKYNISNLTKDSIIKLFYDNKKIEVKAEDINWNLKPNMFFNLFTSDSFTLCFRFPKLNEINFINLNEGIRKNYKALFRKMLKSKTIECCMNIDSDANNFKYPFHDDEIIQELEEHILFVPFPAKNFYGFSDRISFTIFLNSHINTRHIRDIFIDFDNLFKSELHEVKHIYRLYMHINKPKISLKTPDIKRKTLLKNDLLKDNIKLINDNQQNLEKIYEQRIIPKNKTDSFDYGDILELALNGDKQDIFFIKGSLFRLKEKSWDEEPKNFFSLYFKACKDKKFQFNPSSDELFIKSVMKYFRIPSNIEMINDTYTEKRADNKSTDFSLEGEIDNTYVIIPRMNHYKLKK